MRPDLRLTSGWLFPASAGKPHLQDHRFHLREYPADLLPAPVCVVEVINLITRRRVSLVQC